MKLDAKIESVLFWKSEPLKIKDLCSILNVTEGEVVEALDELDQKLVDRGLKIVKNNESVTLVTDPNASSIIEELSKEELTKDLSKAALETLSIILYQGPIKRSQIDYIRGVNSQFILRALSIRGLIDKKTDPNDERAYIYEASLDLLKFLGIKSKNELPEYEEVQAEIKRFIDTESISNDVEKK